MAAGIHEAGRFHRRTASHAQGSEGILNAVRGGITSIEHGIFMNDKCIEEMLERGTYLVPTLAAVRHILANKNNGVPAWAVEKSERVYEVHKDAFQRFYKAGGRIAMGTDAGTPFNHHGDNAQELAYMVECGMTAIDALRCATSVAADLVDLPDQGRIKEGNAADLVVVDGDPVADIERAARSTHHRIVLKKGSAFGGVATVVGAMPAPKIGVAAGSF
jgi:imidazolonepropionase-like amidohydrolase